MTVLRKTALAVALAAGASAAVADPLTQLFFRQAAGWDSTSGSYFGGGDLTFTGPTAPGAPAVSTTTMQWTGANAGTSQIELTSYTSDNSIIKINPGVGNPAGEWNAGDLFVIDRLLQTNEVISGGPFPNPLWIADTIANLQIFDDAVDGNVVAEDLNSSTEVTFWETQNINDCAGSPSPLFDTGSVPPTTPTGSDSCDDIFSVALSDFAPVKFTLDGYIYSINFTILDGNAFDNNGNPIGTTLTCFPGAPDPRCGLDPDYIPLDGTANVYTPEFAPGSTELFVGAFWTVVPVPAPGVLGLMGLGLAGLGFAARRKKS